jgi:hypothetical protein
MSEDKKNSSEFDTPEAFVESLPTKTNSQLVDELARLEAEEKQLDLEIKRETVAKIRGARQAKLDDARSKLIATMQFLAQRKAVQDRCNHRKGGIGHQMVMQGQGTDAMFAVFKHRKPNGTWMVLCARCGKEWHQPFLVQGYVVEAGTEGWQEALNYPTDNSPSGSAIFSYQKDLV